MQHLLDASPIVVAVESDTSAIPSGEQLQRCQLARHRLLAMQLARVIYALVALMSVGIAITHSEYFPHAQPIARIIVLLVAGIGATLCSVGGIWHDMARFRRL